MSSALKACYLSIAEKKIVLNNNLTFLQTELEHTCPLIPWGVSYSDVRQEEICPSRPNRQPDIQLSEEINIVWRITDYTKIKAQRTVLMVYSNAAVN